MISNFETREWKSRKEEVKINYYVGARQIFERLWLYLS